MNPARIPLVAGIDDDEAMFVDVDDDEDVSDEERLN